MAFIIKESNELISIISNQANKALTFVDPKYSLSKRPEYYITNSSVTSIDEPYYNVEQALDDFEYLTSKLPSKVVLSFKNRVMKVPFIENSALDEQFSIEEDGEFINLIDNDAKCQLCFYPASETLTGEPEYIITSLDYEPVEDFEVLSEPFTTQLNEAIQIFEDMVGAIPNEFISKFEKKINGAQ